MCKIPVYQITKKQEKEIRERITQVTVNFVCAICVQSDKGNAKYLYLINIYNK